MKKIITIIVIMVSIIGYSQETSVL